MPPAETAPERLARHTEGEMRARIDGPTSPASPRLDLPRALALGPGLGATFRYESDLSVHPCPEMSEAWLALDPASGRFVVGAEGLCLVLPLEEVVELRIENGQDRAARFSDLLLVDPEGHEQGVLRGAWGAMDALVDPIHQALGLPVHLRERVY